MKDRRGSVLPIFAVALIPLMGAMGLATDYSTASNIQTQMQTAADAAALAVAKMPLNSTQAQREAQAKLFYEANFNPARLINPSLMVNISGPNILISASGQIKTSFTPVIGVSTLSLSAKAESTTGSSRKLEVALVLDNTGSMKGTKISELKKASLAFLDIMEASRRQADDVKVSIVPFTTNVRLDKSTTSNSWFKSAPSKSWDGCVTDRDMPYDTDDTMPSVSNVATRYVVSSGCNIQQVKPLTTSFTDLRTTINNMVADGATNTTIGLVWGWHMLSPNDVYTQGAPLNTDKLDRAIIMLTDGENRQNRFTSDESAIDARMRLACANVKNAGILLYTVRVIDGNAALLRDCATNSGMYFDVKNAEQLTSVFKNIAMVLSNLRLSK